MKKLLTSLKTHLLKYFKVVCKVGDKPKEISDDDNCKIIKFTPIKGITILGMSDNEILEDIKYQKDS